MRKLILLLVVLSACNNSNPDYDRQKREETIKKAEEAYQAAIWGPNWRFRVDSAKKADEKLKADLIEKDLKKFYKTKAGRIHKKHPDWSREVCQDLADNKVWIGMTYEMLLVQRGKPNHVSTSNYGNGNEYQCCWTDWNPSCFYMGENDIITSYN